MTQYVLNNFSKKSPTYCITQEDVSTALQELEMEQITGHQSVRGRGGVIVVLNKAYWTTISELSWVRDMDFHFFRSHDLRHWAGIQDKHRQTNRLYR